MGGRGNSSGFGASDKNYKAHFSADYMEGTARQKQYAQALMDTFTDAVNERISYYQEMAEHEKKVYDIYEKTHEPILRRAQLENESMVEAYRSVSKEFLTNVRSQISSSSDLIGTFRDAFRNKKEAVKYIGDVVEHDAKGIFEEKLKKQRKRR